MKKGGLGTALMSVGLFGVGNLLFLSAFGYLLVGSLTILPLDMLGVFKGLFTSMFVYPAVLLLFGGLVSTLYGFKMMVNNDSGITRLLSGILGASFVIGGTTMILGTEGVAIGIGGAFILVGLMMLERLLKLPLLRPLDSYYLKFAKVVNGLPLPGL